MGNNLISLSDVSCQRLFLKMMICVMDVGWNRKKNFIQPPETPYEKKLCFSRLLRLLCKLRVSDPDRPLACKDEEEWVFVVALYLFVRIFFMSFWKRVIYRGCAEITDLKPAWRWALLQPFVLAFRNF